MRMRNRHKTRDDALVKLREENSWFCACGTMIEDESEHSMCRRCVTYRDDLAAGLYQDEDSWK